MTNQEVKENLGYLKELAEQGSNAPLLGGRVGLMWTGLLVPTLLIHGLAATGKIGFPVQNIGMLWMGFGIVGGILSALLARGLDKKPGSGSLGNRIESISWPVTAVLIFAFAISIAVAVMTQGAGHELFNMIVPFAFGLGAVNMILLGRITRQSFLTMSGIASGLFMILTAIFIQNPNLYFVAAAGVVVTGILPGLIQMRKEPANVA